jgi:sugar phosphate isomerase/epimerase
VQLSITSWSFPACSLSEAAGISKALGIGALDVGLLGQSALNKAEILSDPVAAAEQLFSLGVTIPNYYHLFGSDLADRNLALPGTVDQNRRDLEKVLRFADAASIPSVFVLPGVVNAGQSRREALTVATDSLNALAQVAEDFSATLCIEPHMHSFAESPSIVLELIDKTGVSLVLDYAHLICLGYRQEEIDALAPHAAHIHLRQARAGVLQTPFAHGTLNFPALFGTLRAAHYSGALSIEFVHQDYMNTLFEDVLTETIAMRDCFLEWEAGL